MKQKLILAFLIFLSPVFVKGQETVVYDPSVKTVVFQDNSASNRAMPVFPLLVLGESKKSGLALTTCLLNIIGLHIPWN